MKELITKIKKANYVYICGNGGSASTANHFANDLVKMCSVKAISLCSNEAVMTAFANDNGYDNVFYDQLRILFQPGDLLITISGSGKSENILKAIELAKWRGGDYYAFPTMNDLGCDMQTAEDKHLQLVHKVSIKLSRG